MRKIIYGMNVSLDGYIEDVHGSIGFTTPDEELHRHFNEWDRSFDTYLYGRRLYEIMAAFWPYAEDDPDNPEYIKEYARQWMAKKKIVFSHTLDHVDWNSKLFTGDLVTEVNGMKAQPGLDICIGGPNLAETFIKLDLIDEYQFHFVPILLGGGKPMIPLLNEAKKLTFLGAQTFKSGVVFLRYSRR